MRRALALSFAIALGCAKASVTPPAIPSAAPMAVAPPPSIAKPSTTPSSAGSLPRVDVSKSLELKVTITLDGYLVDTKLGHVAPGCRAFGAGVSVPGRAGVPHDFEGLTRCAQWLKGETGTTDTTVTIAADPNLAYSVIVSTIDALRASKATAGEPAQELFSEFRILSMK
ncbi:MAG: hypothetical protein U0174_18070 [Polyangiaceae bacterium]